MQCVAGAPDRILCMPVGTGDPGFALIQLFRGYGTLPPRRKGWREIRRQNPAFGDHLDRWGSRDRRYGRTASRWHSRRADRLCAGQTVSDASRKPINVDLESIVSDVEV